jgi:hypothetical protein
MMLLTLLSACGPDLEVLPADPAGDDSGEFEELPEQQAADPAHMGSGTVHYRNEFDVGDIRGRAIADIPVTIELDPAQPERFLVRGSNIISGLIEIVSADDDARCSVICAYPVRYSLEGEMTQTSEGVCQIAVNFMRDLSIGTPSKSGDCPELIQEEIDCSQFSAFGDDRTYQFTKDKPVDGTDPLDAINSFQQAEIKDVVMPDTMEDICDW